MPIWLFQNINLYDNISLIYYKFKMRYLHNYIFTLIQKTTCNYF